MEHAPRTHPRDDRGDETAVCDGRLDDMRVRSVSAGRGLVLLKSIVVGRVRNAGHALLSGPGVFRGGVPVP
jgi:hypothetical protein